MSVLNLVRDYVCGEHSPGYDYLFIKMLFSYRNAIKQTETQTSLTGVDY